MPEKYFFNFLFHDLPEKETSLQETFNVRNKSINFLQSSLKSHPYVGNPVCKAFTEMYFSTGLPTKDGTSITTINSLNMLV